MDTVKIMTEFERGYVSGIIDGEGSLIFGKRKNKHIKRGFEWYPVLSITNTNLKILLEMKRILGGGTIHQGRNYLFGKKKTYQYRANPNLLRKILPQLRCIEKEKDSVLLIDALRIIKYHRKTDRWFPEKVKEKDIVLEDIYQKIRKNHGYRTKSNDSALRR